MNQNLANSPNPIMTSDQKKRLTPFLLLSGFFVAISFTVMLIPMAIFSIAQLSAMLNKRTAALVMFCVSGCMLLVGYMVESSLFVVSGFSILAAIPFFMAAIYLREKRKPSYSAGFILFLPTLLAFACTCFMPTLNSKQYDNQISIIENKIEQSKNQINNSPTKTDTSTKAQIDDLSKRVHSLLALKELRQYMGFSPWQRILWFLFGAGSSLFFTALIISFANLLFLDLGFEQVDKLRAIINYIMKHLSSFPNEFSKTLIEMPMVKFNKLSTDVTIVSHSHLYNNNFSNKGFLNFIIKPLKPKNVISLRGYSFVCEGSNNSWNLKNFTLPLSLSLICIVFISCVCFWFGSAEQVILGANNNPKLLPFLAISCFLSFSVLSLLTLQGMYTVYYRISGIFAVAILFLFIVFSSSYSFGPYALLAVFGAVGLLDYVYDWRGRQV